MKIAYVITRADAVGGATIHVRDMAAGMLSRGHEAMVFVGGEGPVTEQFKAVGAPFRPLRFLQRAVNPVLDLQAYRELSTALAEYRPDLVSTHTAKAGWIGRAACARLGVPALYTPHGWPFAERMGRARGLVFSAAEKAAAKWTCAFVCVSEAERALALRRRIAGFEKLHVIHNGVHDVPESLWACPRSRPVRIVSVARLEPPKDHRTLLGALASLRTEEWELELIGGGPREQSARNLAASLGIASRIRWTCYQPSPAAALARAQIFVLSSLSEGFPRSILEAMRAGLPVVASDVGGVGEAIFNGENGYLVPRRNPAALADALLRLMKDDSERERLGVGARRMYEDRFRFETMFGKTVALYGTVIDTISARNQQPT